MIINIANFKSIKISLKSIISRILSWKTMMIEDIDHLLWKESVLVSHP